MKTLRKLLASCMSIIILYWMTFGLKMEITDLRYWINGGISIIIIEYLIFTGEMVEDLLTPDGQI